MAEAIVFSLFHGSVGTDMRMTPLREEADWRPISGCWLEAAHDLSEERLEDSRKRQTSDRIHGTDQRLPKRRVRTEAGRFRGTKWDHFILEATADPAWLRCSRGIKISGIKCARSWSHILGRYDAGVIIVAVANIAQCKLKT